MRILFDHHVFSWQKYGGVSKYFAELIQKLREENVECVLPVLLTKNYHIKSVSNRSIRINDWKGSYHFIEFFNRINSNYHINKTRYDLFHPTTTNEYFLRQIKDKPFVVTAHDLTIELFPEHFSSQAFTKKAVEERIKIYNKASRIIAISHNTKKDLVDFYKINPDKIDVVYHGYSKDVSSNEPLRNFPFLKEKYPLYVGSRREYKNFDNFLKAASYFVKDNVYLICVGGGAFTKEETEQLQSLKLDKYILQYDVNNRELEEIYQHALLFVYPSLYEGFGMPILEAFANNCPVALSDIEIFKEIAGDAAVYFNPYSSDSLKASIESIISSEFKRAELIAKGAEMLKKYSWEQTAKQTIASYTKAVS